MKQNKQPLARQNVLLNRKRFIISTIYKNPLPKKPYLSIRFPRVSIIHI